MTQTVRRHDRTLLGSAQRTPQGGVRLPARPTRVGVLEYLRDDGSIQREYRPPEEVFSDASLQSLADATVTDLHSGTVNPATYRDLTRGHVSGMPTQDGDFVSATLVVQDAEEIALIDAGERVELSCGYDCVLEMKAGTTDAGEAYDAIQRAITYNHVAIGPANWGRAGSDVRVRLDSKSGLPVLRLDAAGHQIPPGATMPTPTNKQPKKDEGVPPEDKKTDGTCPHCGAPVGEDGKFVAPKVDETPAPKEPEATPAPAPAPAPEAKVDARELVRTRVGLERVAMKAGIAEHKLDSMTDVQLQRAVIGKAFPEYKLDGKSDAEIVALFGLAKEHVATVSLADPLSRREPHRDSGSGLLSDFAITQRASSARKGS